MRNLTREERLFAVKEAQTSNKTFSTIARQLNCDRRTISRVVARFNENGLLNENERSGRPVSLNEEQKRSVDKYISKNPTSTAKQIANFVYETFSISINERTIQRYRRDLGYSPRKQGTRVQPTQTQLDKHHLFALEHQNSNLKKWIFIDETQVQLRNTGKIVWVKRGTPTPPHEIFSLRACVNLWGAIWWNGRTFSRFEGYINQNIYQQLLHSCLRRHVRRWRQYAVVQDKLRSHWRASIRQWFNDHDLKLLDWPAHAPKFNAIEYVWHLLKEMVKKAQPKSQAELEAAVDQSCDIISQKVIQGCISHISNLLKEEASK